MPFGNREQRWMIPKHWSEQEHLACPQACQGQSGEKGGSASSVMRPLEALDEQELRGKRMERADKVQWLGS